MRFLAACLLWLITTAALAVAVPTAWVQRNLIDADGYAALAQQAAADPVLQSAVAAELSAHAATLIDQRGDSVDPWVARDVAAEYVASPDFPPQFAQANRIAQHWMFTPQTGQGGWVVDLAPMLGDPAFAQLLNDYQVQLPSTVTVPVTVTGALRPGLLQPVATWGPWVRAGVVALTGICAVATLMVARRRGKALAALGVSALLVGAGGWAAIEAGRRYLNDALNHSVGNVRQIADVIVAVAERSLHQWLDLTLAAGGVLVVLGVLAAMLGGLRKA